MKVLTKEFNTALKNAKNAIVMSLGNRSYTNVHLKTNPTRHTLLIEGCDGTRLGKAEIELKDEHFQEIDILINNFDLEPIKTTNNLLSIIMDNDTKRIMIRK